MRYLLIVSLLLGCATYADATVPPSSKTSDSTPMTVSPFMVRPFSGEHVVSNVFDHAYPFPFEETGGDQLSWWGERIIMGYDGHRGYDFLMDEGTPLKAVAEGEVVFAGVSPAFFCRSPSVNRQVSDQLSIKIKHIQNEHIFYSYYTHLSGITVTEGQTVTARQTIGFSGDTGCSTAPHLHFDVQRQMPDGRLVSVDPYGWQGGSADPWQSHAEGSESYTLWLEGEAPALFSEIRLGDDFSVTNPVWINAVRFMGVHDKNNPNNERIELIVHPESEEGVYLGNHKLVSDGQTIYTFAPDFFLEPGRATKVYLGTGNDTKRSLYAGLSEALLPNHGGCIQLLKPDGRSLFNFWYHRGECT